jgi:replicative DNA helicase
MVQVRHGERPIAVRPDTHALQAEQAALGAMLIDRRAIAQVLAILGPDDLQEPRHRPILEAVRSMHDEGVGIDAVTVTDRLSQQQDILRAGGLTYIAKLAADTPTAANAEHYARQVKDRADRRRHREWLLDELQRIDQAGNASAAELATRTLEGALKLQGTHRGDAGGLVSAADLATALLEDLDSRASGKRGLEFGLPDFDRLTGGLEEGDLVVIAGRPSVGKSATMVTLASVAAQHCSVAIFSAEMPALQVMRRWLAQVTNLPQNKLRRPESMADADWVSVSNGAAELQRRRLWIDDKAQPTVAHIRAELAALKAKGDLGLAIIDYLQLLTGNGRNRYEELRDVAYGLKALAKDLRIPIIALAQVNRDVESRDEKRPQVSDLRDSGAIEEAADVIGMLYSEGHYHPDFSLPWVLECNLLKVRNGERGQCLWCFDGSRSLIEPLDSGAVLQYRRLLAEARRPNTRGANL